MRSRTAVLLAALFGGITLAVISGATAGFDDAAVAAASDAAGNTTLDMTVQIITETGDIWYMLGLGILLIVVRRTRRIGITFMILLVISTLLAGYIKCGVDRDRPAEIYEATHLPVQLSRDTFALFCEGGFVASYPSGHAMRSMIIAILLAYGLSNRFPRGAYLMFVYPALISVSRVMVLQHYPTDVIGGMVLGVLLTGILSHYTRLRSMFRLQT